GTIYVGSQYLYKSVNKGDSWQKISPDLSTNDPEKQKQEESGGLSVDNSSAENHCTIFAICESPVDVNVVWAGTDDGNLQVTENSGGSWTNAAKNVTGVPKNAWVSSIDASKFERNTAFVTFDNHAMGDHKAYIFKTTDLGKTWTSIATSDINGYAHKIKQDIINPNLLFAGTAFGLYISIDGGISWVQYNANVPNVEVRDISIQPETGDLLIASHGRGIYVIDDLTPYRNVTQDILNSEAAFLPTRQNYVYSGFLGGSFPDEAGFYVGQNATEDAVIMYYLKDRVVTGDVRLEIYDTKGNLLNSLPGTKRKGINKITWDMRLKPPKVAKAVRPDQSGFSAPYVPEGVYTLKLIKGTQVIEGNLDLKVHPFCPHSSYDIAMQQETSLRLYKMQEDLAFMVENVGKVQSETEKMMKEDKVSEKTGKALIDKLEDLRKTLVATKEGQITGEERLRERLGWLYVTVVWYNGKPTDQQLDRISGLQYEMDEAQKKVDDIYRNYLSKVNSELKSGGAAEIQLMTREAFDKKDVSSKQQGNGMFDFNWK
ncbi:MAG TPA: glycosyl hydrolase, partial [Ignavibacteria bacterium]